MAAYGQTQNSLVLVFKGRTWSSNSRVQLKGTKLRTESEIAIALAEIKEWSWFRPLVHVDQWESC